MQKLGKTKNGITLIALIITIIVMLILVAVIVTIAIEGDLFNKTKTAAQKMEKETVKEVDHSELQAAVIEAIDPKTMIVDGWILESYLESKGWTVDWEVPKISETESYVGCLADVDGDREPDGIIFGDLAFGQVSSDIIPPVNNLPFKEYTIVKTGIKGKFRSRSKRCNIPYRRDKWKC